MSYSSLREAAKDLESVNQLIRVKSEVDPDQEMTIIHNRIFENKGPAILFENVKGSKFQAISNIYGSFDRTDFLFRKSIKQLKTLLELKADPSKILKTPLKYIGVANTALKALPGKNFFKPASMFGKTKISELPLIKSWPMDGGAFVTMPQVLTLPPDTTDIMKSNVGMYRIQLSGNDYELDREVGLHYQLHRGIGIHHQAYNESNEPFKCSIFIGGPPSHAFAAIMPMPEGISELTFAGMLGGRKFRYFKDEKGHIISADADFVITGVIEKNMKKPEGPFGDHLGYYSLTHDFPVMKIDNVYHRKDPLWHFSVVGRPPMEDSSFGYLIHQLVKELTPGEFPGVKEIHAVDAAGVHPLLLAIGKERYMPFREKVPEEILTIANRIIGSGQTSLAKYLMIAAEDDNPNLSASNIEEFLDHLLARINWARDLHFITNTTIDTLDYSGSGWNQGSKVIMACRGKILRKLDTEFSQNVPANGYIKYIKIARPGVLGIKLDSWQSHERTREEMQYLCPIIHSMQLDNFPLIVICDDPDFISQTLNNFLWVTFTRSNPSHDIYGVGERIVNKHWACDGPLIIDARIKKHHAPVLIPDQAKVKNVDKLFAKGGELYGYG